MELVSQTAGIGVGLPDPENAIEAALHLGLLKKRANIFEVTSIGIIFMKHRDRVVNEISRGQAKLLFGLMIDDAELRGLITSLFSRFKKDQETYFQLPGSLFKADRSLAQVASFLHQLHVLSYENGDFTFNSEFDMTISEDLVASVSLNEEDLWKKLDEIRLRAQLVEKLVLEEEKKRVAQLGRSDLVEAITRVSATDPGKGYDIQSFNHDGTSRYIEVKSSKGNHIRFEWSARERTQAEKLKGQYWIYLVPLSHVLPDDYCRVLMIQDPISLIATGHLIELAADFFVSSTPDFAITKIFRFSQQTAMLEFTKNSFRA